MISTKSSFILGYVAILLLAVTACTDPSQVWDRSVPLSSQARAAEEAYQRQLSPGYFAVSADGTVYAYTMLSHSGLGAPELTVCTNFACFPGQRYGTNVLLGALQGCRDAGGVDCRILWETRRRLAP